MPQDWIDRASKRLLAPLRVELSERRAKEGHGAQAQLARDIGIDPTLLSKWLSGARPRVDIATIEAVAEFFRLEPWYVFSENVDDDWKKYTDARLEPSLTDDGVELVLTRLNATEVERTLLREQMRTFRSHRMTASMIETFLYGLRARGTKR